MHLRVREQFANYECRARGCRQDVAALLRMSGAEMHFGFDTISHDRLVHHGGG